MNENNENIEMNNFIFKIEIIYKNLIIFALLMSLLIFRQKILLHMLYRLSLLPPISISYMPPLPIN